MKPGAPMAEQKGRTKMGEEKAGGAARGSSAADVLRAAKALIRKGWCQGHYASTRAGVLADVLGEVVRPAKFCADGALMRASRCIDALYGPAWRMLVRAVGGVGITGWNDDRHRTKKQVLAAFDRAIEMASTASAPKEPPEPTPDPEAQRG